MDEDWSSGNSNDTDRIREIIARDGKDEFTSFLERSFVINSGDLVKLKFSESEFCLSKLLGWICTYNAVYCGTALVEGKAGLNVDLNSPFNQGATVLHEAASSLSAGLVELFLHNGAQADCRCNAVDSEKHGLLPLHLALERASSIQILNEWTPKQSIFKLIIILCLPIMKEALETNRLLAQNTKEVKEVVRHCAKESKLVELAILLMVAQEKVMEPITFQSEVDSTSKLCITFRQCVKSELAALIDHEFLVMGKKKERKFLRSIKERKIAMMSTLLLLEIFERAGSAIGAYVQLERTDVSKEQVAQELAELLAKAGFKLSSKDTDLGDVVDGPFQLVLGRSGVPVDEQKEKLEETIECGFKRLGIGMPSYSPPGNFVDRSRIRCVPNEPWRCRTRFPYGPSVLHSVLNPFHASWTSNASFCSGFSKPMEVQVKEMVTGRGHYSHNLSSSKQWASLASAVRRGIRCL